MRKRVVPFLLYDLDLYSELDLFSLKDGYFFGLSNLINIVLLVFGIVRSVSIDLLRVGLDKLYIEIFLSESNESSSE